MDDFTDSNKNFGELVVDGYIEYGKRAKVVLTHSIHPQSVIDSTHYLDIVTTRADVRISNGELSEYLILRRNQNSFPQHYYESNKIIGEAGKEYTLEVMYRGDTLKAVTKIPDFVNVDTVWTVPSENESKEMYIWIRLCDNGITDNYYRTFTRIISRQSEFVPTHVSTFNNTFFLGECINHPVYKGLERFYDNTISYSFTKGDTVLVKIASIDRSSYLFWNSFEKEAVGFGNPFAGHGTNLESNINMGLGIWTGYNQTVFPIIIQ